MAFLEHSEHDVPGLLGDWPWPAAGSWRSTGPIGAATPFLIPAPSTSWWSWVGAGRPSIPGWDGSAPSGRWSAESVVSDVPVLGVCFGGQLLAQVLGGTVTRAIRPEIGWRAVQSDDPDRIPEGPWLVWHEDAFTAPPGAEALARTDVSLHAFVAGIHTGVQFHPEVTKEIVGHWVDNARAGVTSSPARPTISWSASTPEGRDPRHRPPDCSRASSSGAASPADPASAHSDVRRSVDVGEQLQELVAQQPQDGQDHRCTHQPGPEQPQPTPQVPAGHHGRNQSARASATRAGR